MLLGAKTPLPLNGIDPRLKLLIRMEAFTIILSL
jgi:hypothetical protein